MRHSSVLCALTEARVRALLALGHMSPLPHVKVQVPWPEAAEARVRQQTHPLLLPGAARHPSTHTNGVHAALPPGSLLSLSPAGLCVCSWHRELVGMSGKACPLLAPIHLVVCGPGQCLAHSSQDFVPCCRVDTMLVGGSMEREKLVWPPATSVLQDPRTDAGGWGAPQSASGSPADREMRGEARAGEKAAGPQVQGPLQNRAGSQHMAMVGGWSLKAGLGLAVGEAAGAVLRFPDRVESAGALWCAVG